MNTYIKTLLDSFGNQLFPRTRVDAVYLEDNTTTLPTALDAIDDSIALKQDIPTLDKTTPVDGDKALIYDSADSNVAKKLSWANIKATLKTYFDTHYNIGGATAKTTPVDADQIGIADSATSNTIKKVTFTNLKAFLKTYFDTLYPPKASPTLTGTPIAPTAAAGTNTTQIATTAFVQQEVVTPTTLTHTQTESIKSLPTGSLDGKVSNFEANGLSLVNSVVNGDFSNGTTGWTSYSSSNSVTNKILSNTASGSNPTPSLTKTLPYVSGEKHFIFAKTRALSSECIGLYLQFYNGVSFLMSVKKSPSINTWIEHYFIVTAGTTGNLTFEVKHEYTSSAIASGKVMEVDGNAGVFAINMTALGIASYTEAQMLDLIRGGYFDGLKGVENAKFETVGKNLFDVNFKTKSASGYTSGNAWLNNGVATIATVDGGILLSYQTASNRAVRITDKIKLEVGKTYHLSYNRDSGSGFIRVYGVSGDYYHTYDDYGGEFTVIDGFENIELAFFTNSTTTPMLFSNIQLEEGTVATAYEPYKSSQLSANVTLRSVPSGIKDRIFEQDGQIWLEKNVEENVLDQSKSWDSQSTNTLVYTLRLLGGNPAVSTDVTRFIFANQDLLFPVSTSDVDVEQMRILNTTDIRLYILKTRIDSLAGATIIDKIKTYLTSKPIKIHYQLATPQLINLSEQGKANGELSSFANGTSYLGGDTFHVSNVEFYTPANAAATIKSLAEGENYQAKQIAQAVTKTSDTGAARIPTGTTEQRDATPIEGMIRFNSSLDQFEGYFNGSWQSVGGGQLLGTTPIKAISYNAQTISENITIPSNYNAMSVGPITIADGYTLTIEDGAVYKII